ncbi:uncharacterized protein PG986_014558 [Apiospora aurea]|uniref:Uncharacterized protein n=1 Tax=Apiospora aurea TaxID=335848 RepID=A0ABR1PTV4_9PEZI
MMRCQIWTFLPRLCGYASQHSNEPPLPYGTKAGRAKPEERSTAERRRYYFNNLASRAHALEVTPCGAGSAPIPMPGAWYTCVLENSSASVARSTYSKKYVDEDHQSRVRVATGTPLGVAHRPVWDPTDADAAVGSIDSLTR